jgi:hypothetical protein
MTPQQTRYFNLMRRFCQVGALLPDREKVDFNDPRSAAEIELLLKELGRIGREMDQVAAEAERINNAPPSSS